MAHRNIIVAKEQRGFDTTYTPNNGIRSQGHGTRDYINYD